MGKNKVQQAFELIREEAVNRLLPVSDYPGKLCEVSNEVSSLLMAEMEKFREAEREDKTKCQTDI